MIGATQKQEIGTEAERARVAANLAAAGCASDYGTDKPYAMRAGTVADAREVDKPGIIRATVTLEEGSGRAIHEVGRIVEKLEAENRRLTKERDQYRAACALASEARMVAQKELAELNAKIDDEINRRMAAHCRAFAESIDPSKQVVDDDGFPTVDDPMSAAERLTAARAGRGFPGIIPSGAI